MVDAQGQVCKHMGSLRMGSQPDLELKHDSDSDAQPMKTFLPFSSTIACVAVPLHMRLLLGVVSDCSWYTCDWVVLGVQATVLIPAPLPAALCHWQLCLALLFVNPQLSSTWLVFPLCSPASYGFKGATWFCSCACGCCSSPTLCSPVSLGSCLLSPQGLLQACGFTQGIMS